MTLARFTIAILLLLATPGPTNTLIALSGYGRGWVRSLPLIGAELCGYLAVIVPVASLAAPVFETHPQAALWAKLIAGGWLFYLSFRLWKSDRKGEKAGHITQRQVLVTTLLNPKALIIALVIMPHGGLTDLLPWLGLLCLLVVLAANGWILFGCVMRHAKGFQIKPLVIRRAAACCLLLFASILAGTSLQALA